MSETLIITFIMLASIALIIVLMINSVKKQARGKMRKLESKLAELTGQRKLNISRKEKLRNRLVAADASEQALIHLWLERDEPAYELIHFNKVKKCEIVKLSNRITEKSAKGKNQVHEQVTAIHLQFATDKNIFTIPFYSEVEDGVLEMQELTKRAEEWRTYIGNTGNN
ncbi:MAG: hypothetical protein JST70_01335 [Bacteroidetes bacterium]|nr:hypothetical protein [Bacteroidota bacterium]